MEKSHLNALYDQIGRPREVPDSFRPNPSDIRQRLLPKIRIGWNYHPNKIEGNTLTLGEPRALLIRGLRAARGEPVFESDK
jgi:hypothetical protein